MSERIEPRVRRFLSTRLLLERRSRPGLAERGLWNRYAFNLPLAGKAIATPTLPARYHTIPTFNPPLAGKAIATLSVETPSQKTFQPCVWQTSLSTRFLAFQQPFEVDKQPPKRSLEAKYSLLATLPGILPLLRFAKFEQLRWIPPCSEVKTINHHCCTPAPSCWERAQLRGGQSI